MLYSFFMFFLKDSEWETKKTEKKGRGVFTKVDIEPGTIIGDYLGQVVHPADEATIQDEACFYLMYYHDRASIFPDLKKPGIYLINHSCIPNVWMYTYRGHTLFFATRKIFKGEELLVNYLLSPLDESCKPCEHMCHCGTILCHSTMHLTEKKYDLWSEFHDKEMGETKRERIRYKTMLPPLDKYPNEIKDHPLYTMFGYPKESSLVVKGKKIPSTKDLRLLIRNSGRKLLFPELKIEILGIEDDVVYSKEVE